eukprot:scaffold13094_cov70-Phaeocystis_antarctica.AAC.15
MRRHIVPVEASLRLVLIAVPLRRGQASWAPDSVRLMTYNLDTDHRHQGRRGSPSPPPSAWSVRKLERRTSNSTPLTLRTDSE